MGAADLPPIEAYPRADVVTYRYYVGRLAFLDEDYTRVRRRMDARLTQAESELYRALAMCPARARKHMEYVCPCSADADGSCCT